MVQRGCGSCSNVGHVGGFHATPRTMAYHRLDQRGGPLFVCQPVFTCMHLGYGTHSMTIGKKSVLASAPSPVSHKYMHRYLYCVLWLQDVLQPCFMNTCIPTQAFSLLLQYKGHTESVWVHD